MKTPNYLISLFVCFLPFIFHSDKTTSATNIMHGPWPGGVDFERPLVYDTVSPPPSPEPIVFPPCQGVITFEVEYTVGACQACTCSGNCTDCKMVNLIAKVMVNGEVKDPGQCGWDISWSSSPNWCSVTNPNSLTPSMNYRLCDLTPNGNNFTANVKLTLLIPDEDPVSASKTVIFFPCQPPPAPMCNPVRPNYKPWTKCVEDNTQNNPLPGSSPGIINCGPSGPDPLPTAIDIKCEPGNDMASYLARSVEVKSMWDLATLTNFGNDLAIYDHTTMPPTLLRSEQQIFCEQLRLLTDMKATMITYSTQYYGYRSSYIENVTNPDDLYSYIAILGRMVASINYAFDCAGLKRPVIQGGIWESVSAAICRIEIPPCVINHFYDEIIAEGQDAVDRYLNQSPVQFNYLYICNDQFVAPQGCSDVCDLHSLPGNCYSCGPDFAKLETRMWYYHVGTLLIDAGFTSILIGQGGAQGATEGGTDPDNFYQTSIVNDLRYYAANVSEPHTDLIMKLESEGDYNYANDNGNFPSNELLADYNDLGLRPREVFLDGNGNPINVGDLNDRNTSRPGCEGSGEYIPAELFGPECDGQPYLAFFDICHSGGYGAEGIEVEGYTDTGDNEPPCFTENQPRIYTWDSGPTCYTNYNGPPIPPGQYFALKDNDPSDGDDDCNLQNLGNCVNGWMPSQYSVWGWDDVAWWTVGFKPKLQGAVPDPLTGIVAIDMAALDNDACRLEWLRKTMADIRNSTPDGNSFLVMKTFDAGETLVDKPACTGTITLGIPQLDLSDPDQHPGLQDDLAALWAPIPISTNSIGVDENCVEIGRGGSSCDIGCGNTELNRFEKQFTFFVEDPDLTSLYQIQVEVVGASDQFIREVSEFSYGKQKSVFIGELLAGEKVKVTFRQVNMGLIPLLDDDGILDGIRVVAKIYDNLDPCCETETIPVTVFRIDQCWVQLSIPDNEAAGVGQFFWTTDPTAPIYPADPPKASEVVVKLNGLNATYLNFCVVGLDENGVVKTGKGVVSPLGNCGSKLTISPNPNPVNTNETLTVLLSGDVMDEVQANNTPLTLNFVRSADGFIAQTLVTAEEVNQMDILDFQDGLHWIVANYNGTTYSASFVVEAP